MTAVDGLQMTTATIPTDEPESDGTLAWDSTTIVVMEVRAGGRTGLGWTYGHQAAASIIASTLKGNVVGASAMDIPGVWLANQRAVQGITRVKIKVGRDPERDRHRAAVVRAAIGEDTELYVDANGAYDRQQALYWAHVYAEQFGVSYFEEPVSSEDPEGLRYLRDRVPPRLSIAAGEYGWALPYFAGLAEQVHVVQADVTRCGGITNLLRVGALCQAHQLPFSAHCVPNISAHACCAIQPLAHIEYFHDHARIEQLLFDGTLNPHDGALAPHPDRPGLGLELKRSELERYAT